MKKFIGILLSLFSINVFAQMYVAQESNGDIIYSDIPIPTSPVASTENIKPPLALPGTITPDTTTIKKVEAKSPSVAPETVAIKKVETKPAEVPFTYKKFRITSPLDKEAFQNQQSVSIEMQVKPKLQEGDRVQLYVDGKQIEQPKPSLKLNTGPIERGSHEVYCVIVDKNNTYMIQSNVITIYTHLTHLGNANKKLPSKKISKKILTPKAFLVHNQKKLHLHPKKTAS